MIFVLLDSTVLLDPGSLDLVHQANTVIRRVYQPMQETATQGTTANLKPKLTCLSMLWMVADSVPQDTIALRAQEFLFLALLVISLAPTAALILLLDVLSVLLVCTVLVLLLLNQVATVMLDIIALQARSLQDQINIFVQLASIALQGVAWL